MLESGSIIINPFRGELFFRVFILFTSLKRGALLALEFERSFDQSSRSWVRSSSKMDRGLCVKEPVTVDAQQPRDCRCRRGHVLWGEGSRTQQARCLLR